MSDKRDQYGYLLTFPGKVYKEEWQIYKCSHSPSLDMTDARDVVAVFPYDEAWEGDGPPPAVRAEYERLIEYDPSAVSEQPCNIVEILSDEDGGFDQPCRFGNRVEDHAVYCHNTTWLYAPRKCRRTWYTDGERRDEDCEGFSPNPTFKVTA